MNNTDKKITESAGTSNSPLEVQKLNLRTQLSEKYGFVAIKIDRLTIMGNVELHRIYLPKSLKELSPLAIAKDGYYRQGC